jgi:hypothetical protein
METITHFLASLDIFQILINAFPSIFNPIIHGFQNLFILLFTSLKHLVELNPGLIGGMFFILAIYGIFTLAQNLRKVRVK